MITTNYGRLGGTLDNTKHLEAGARATLTDSEQNRWRMGEQRPQCGRIGHVWVELPAVGTPQDN